MAIISTRLPFLTHSNGDHLLVSLPSNVKTTYHCDSLGKVQSTHASHAMMNRSILEPMTLNSCDAKNSVFASSAQLSMQLTLFRACSLASHNLSFKGAGLGFVASVEWTEVLGDCRG